MTYLLTVFELYIALGYAPADAWQAALEDYVVVLSKS